MTPQEGSVEYAYARVAARHGRRVDESQWRRIESARTLAGLLDVVRATALERFVANIAADSDVHAIEPAMRAHWRHETATVAAWMPERWQAAVRWFGVLPDVPIASHLAASGQPHPWMQRDPRYRRFLESPASDGDLARLCRPGTSGDAAWFAEWRRRIPHEDAGPLAQLERVARAHLEAFTRHPAGNGASLRRMFQRELAKLFRVAIATPAAAFVFLALELLDVERLRGELVRRAAFPGWPLAR